MSLEHVLRSLFKGLPEKHVLEELMHKCVHHHFLLHDHRDADRWTMLHWAVQNSYKELACYVLALGHSRSPQDNFGATPLMLAA